MRRLVLFCALMLVCGLLPAANASADAVTIRIEGATSTLVERADFNLLSAAVAPTGAPVGETCVGNSVVGAVHVATNGDWQGTWDPVTGWSIDTIKSKTAAVASGRKWVVLINGVLVNDPPCTKTLADHDSVTLYPACLTATTNCYSSGPLDMAVPKIFSPGAPIVLQVWETSVTLDSQGNGTSQRAPALSAAVAGPEGSALTDAYYGTGAATLLVKAKGPALFTATKATHAPDHGTACATDGADGYCGTSVPTPTPFDPNQFCQSSGNDGYCNTLDQVPPLGRISTPPNGLTYPASDRPQKLAGTVDFDPSQTDHVDLRLMRKTTLVVTKTKKRKAWVKKRVHGKLVRKRVTRKKKYKVKQTACLGWSVTTSTWKRLKSCDAALASAFRADGADVWSYSFLEKLPAGEYTLDALAQDGAGNVDATPEIGRNRSLFTVR